MPDARLLDLWERGASSLPVARAGLLAALAQEVGLGARPGPVAELTVGQRDRAIVRLHRARFGARVTGTAACRRCGESLDVTFTLDDLPIGDGPGSDADGSTRVPSVRVDWADLVLTCRPLLHGDLVGLAAAGWSEPLELARRCVVAVDRSDGSVLADATADRLLATLAPEALVAVAEAVSAADPGCDLFFALTCPACAHTWDETFDPGSFLWTELDRWARSVIEDVHRLAAAYGWPEADILALSPTRRQAYLTLVAS